jgi:hypothetical protein
LELVSLLKSAWYIQSVSQYLPHSFLMIHFDLLACFHSQISQAAIVLVHKVSVHCNWKSTATLPTLTMTIDSSLGRRRALADAVAGVLGALVSLWTFYPIEVFKTNLQAGYSTIENDKKNKNKSMFQGIGTKTLHTTSSNFCYFFLYSWIVTKYVGPKTEKVNPATRLLLSAVAAMLNTLITLPLDVLSSKKVTQGDEEEKSKDSNETMDKVWDEFQEVNDDSSLSEYQDSLPELEEEKKEETIASITPQKEKEEGSSASDEARRESSFGSLEVDEVGQNWSSLWKGLTPALLLCSNPSINYTVFDIAKTRLLARRQKSINSGLSMPEAFLLGLFAKFVATIATYPLIRAKVILVVTSEKSLVATLCRTYREEGVRGLYKGCDWQLLHAVLKSALMMMVREKLTHSTQRLIVGDEAKKR